MNLLHSLQTKLTASFVLLILVVTSLTFGITYRATQDALLEVTQTELTALAALAASQLHGTDAEAMAALSAGDEETAAFERLRARLAALRDSHPDILYVYTMRRAGDGAAFVVDADYGNAEDPGAAIDESYDGASAELLAGFDGLSVDPEFTTDEWGTVLSGYAPIRDSRGTSVGLVGVDMRSDEVLARQHFIGQTIYWVMGAGIGLAALFILLFSKTIIKDVRHLNDVANRISNGDMDVDVDVERRDEIGQLAASFSRMVASLKLMMSLGGDD